jgi:hypothetical protein
MIMDFGGLSCLKNLLMNFVSRQIGSSKIANAKKLQQRKIGNAKLGTQKFLRCLTFCRTYQREKT